MVPGCLAQILFEMLDLSHDLLFVLNVHAPHYHYSNHQKNHLMRKTHHLMMKQRGGGGGSGGGTRAVAAAFLPASFGCPEESYIEVLEFEAEDECSSSSGSLTGGDFEALNGDCG